MSEVRYTKTHEWARLEGDLVLCGITQHAADELNDLTFLDYRVQPGDDVEQGDVLGEIDSVKATSEMFAPVGGSVEAVNERFQDEDQLPAINKDPEGEGWLVKIKPGDPAQHGQLMDAEAYQKHCAESD